jgi:hypothetical protein
MLAKDEGTVVDHAVILHEHAIIIGEHVIVVREHDLIVGEHVRVTRTQAVRGARHAPVLYARASMSNGGARWYDIRAEGVAHCSHASLQLLESVAIELERNGFHAVAEHAPQIGAYRVAPQPTQSLGQHGGPPLDHRIRELHVWVDGPTTLRYRAAFRPDLFEPILVVIIVAAAVVVVEGAWPLIVGAFMLAALFALAVRRHRTDLRELVENAMRVVVEREARVAQTARGSAKRSIAR